MLMQTSAKIVASVATDELSSIAKVAVASELRGFVEGRHIADNTVDVEGTLLEYSQLLDSLLVVIRFHFAQAFPSLAHAFCARDAWNSASACQSYPDALL